MSLQADIAIQALTVAAQSTDGIRLRIDPVSPGILQPTSRAKQILYQHKKDNSEFTQLVIKFDPVDPEHYLWIYPGKDS